MSSPLTDAPTVSPHFGSAVEGGQRFGRPHLEEKLLRLLKTSNGIAMFGLRRIGKSTLTRYAEDAMHKDGYGVVPVDAQGLRALDHLLFDILRALPKEQGLGQRLLDWVSSNEAAPAALRETLKLGVQGLARNDAKTADIITAYWQAIADQITQILRQDRPQLLLTIDEFPFLCKGILETGQPEQARTIVNQLLAALRLWRDAGLKMVLTGSVGMAALEREYRLDPVHLNDLCPFGVPPLGDRDPTEPARFVEALVRGTPELSSWTDAHTAALLNESVALYPSFLQFAFTKLATAPPPPPEEFPEIFATEIRAELDDPFLNQFDVRLKSYRRVDRDGGEPVDTAGNVGRILGLVAGVHPGWCSRATLAEALGDRLDGFALAELLRLLHEDGFLIDRTQKDGTQDWRLSSPLVLAWWNQRGLGGRR